MFDTIFKNRMFWPLIPAMGCLVANFWIEKNENLIYVAMFLFLATVFLLWRVKDHSNLTQVIIAICLCGFSFWNVDILTQFYSGKGAAGVVLLSYVIWELLVALCFIFRAELGFPIILSVVAVFIFL